MLGNHIWARMLHTQPTFTLPSCRMLKRLWSGTCYLVFQFWTVIRKDPKQQTIPSDRENYDDSVCWTGGVPSITSSAFRIKLVFCNDDNRFIEWNPYQFGIIYQAHSSLTGTNLPELNFGCVDYLIYPVGQMYKHALQQYQVDFLTSSGRSWYSTPCQPTLPPIC